MPSLIVVKTIDLRKKLIEVASAVRSRLCHYFINDLQISQSASSFQFIPIGIEGSPVWGRGFFSLLEGGHPRTKHGREKCAPIR
jgi:hypothetical protein